MAGYPSPERVSHCVDDSIMPEFTSEDIESIVDKVIQDREFKPLEDREIDELMELEDIEDDRVLQ